jgi:predicted  nucleic acid-binding Zn-ribbon protein
MREDVQQLIKIQDLDQRIQAIQKELERIPKEQDLARERLANDANGLASAKSAYQQNEIATKNIDLDRSTRKTTIEKLKVQQFETKKNDEYEKLGNEVIRYEKMVDELETQELELMEKSDLCRENIVKAETLLAKTQGIVDEETSDLNTRADERKSELADLQEARKTETAKVEEDLLADYTRLFIKCEGHGVAEVNTERICSSCHLQVVNSTFIAAKSGERIAECDNCGSILYLT